MRPMLHLTTPVRLTRLTRLLRRVRVVGRGLAVARGVAVGGALFVAGGMLGGCLAEAGAGAVETDGIRGGERGEAGGVASAPEAPGAHPEDPFAGDPVGRFLRTPPGPDEAERIHEGIRSAVEAARNPQAPEAVRRAAVARLDTLLVTLAVAEDWRPLLVAELLAPLGDTAAVARAVGSLDPATGLRGRWGWAIHVEAFVAAGDSAGARRVAQAEAMRARTAEEGAPAWARAGALALAARDTSQARESLRQALRGGVDAPGAQAAARLLDRVGPASGEERLRLARTLLAAEAWEPAVRHGLPFLGASPPLALAPDNEEALRVGVARALVALSRYGEVPGVLGPGLPADPGHRAEARFLLKSAADRQGRPAEARRQALALAEDLPASAEAELALFRLAQRTVAGGGGLERDPELFHALFRVGVGTPASELLAVQLGSRQYLAGDFRAAAATFEEVRTGARRTASRQQAGYWAALSLTRLGEEAGARERLQDTWIEDPLSFYGVLAGERLDQPVLPRTLAPGPAPRLEGRAVSATGLDAEINAALLRLRLHQVVPTPGSFAFELARLEAHFFRQGDHVYDFAEALLEGGFPIQGVVLGREIHRREDRVWNLRLLRIVFPFPYREVIVRESRARGLDPFFVAGLIRQESMFHTSIASSAGAIGLMQLLPGTAQEVARSLGIRYQRPLLEDPEYNVRLGTQYLAQMLRRYDGRAEDALSAYNAGPGRINQWRQRPEYRDRDVFMEHIPFQETRHYVKVVQQNKRIYTALYGCPGFEPCLGDSYRVAVARSPFAGGVPASSLAR